MIRLIHRQLAKLFFLGGAALQNIDNCPVNSGFTEMIIYAFSG